MISRGITIKSAVPGQYVVFSGNQSADNALVSIATTANVVLEYLRIHSNKIQYGRNPGVETVVIDGASSVIVRNCKIHDCGNGILTGNRDFGTWSIVDTEIYDCGTNDGLTHNIYIGPLAAVTMTGSYSYFTNQGSWVDWTQPRGHAFKSRALVTTLKASFFSVAGRGSCAAETPFGGTWKAYGCLFDVGQYSDYNEVCRYGYEPYAGQAIVYPTRPAEYVHSIDFRQNVLVDRTTTEGGLGAGDRQLFAFNANSPVRVSEVMVDNVVFGTRANEFVASWPSNSNVASGAFVAYGTRDYTMLTAIAGAGNAATLRYVSPVGTVPRSDSQRGALPASGLPVWVPAPGMVGAVSLNTIDSLPAADPGVTGSIPTDRTAIIGAWTSGAYCSESGTYGVTRIAGQAGHNSYDDTNTTNGASPGGVSLNEPYEFDHSTRLWARVGDPTPYTAKDITRGETGPSQPANSHGYNLEHYVPPTMTSPTDAKGWYISMGRIFVYRVPVTPDKKMVHVMPLTTNVWQRGPGEFWLNQNLAVVSDSGACVDRTQGVVWVQFPSASLTKYNPVTGVSTAYPSANSIGVTLPVNMTHHSGLNLIIGVANTNAGACKLVGFDPTLANPVWTALATSEPLTTYMEPSAPYQLSGDARGIGFDYHSGLDKIGVMVNYGAGSCNRLVYLTAPASPLSGTWLVTTETFGGTTINLHSPGGTHANSEHMRTYGHFRAIPKMKAFYWCAGTGLPVYYYRPAALT